MKTNKAKILFSVILVLIAISSRLLPHEWNFTAINAVALFSSVFLGMRYSFFIVLFSMLFSDIFIGFYFLPIMISVYGSIILSSVLGRFLGQKMSNQKTTRPFVLSILASTVFFLVTNAAVWYFGTMYTKDFGGLMNSYTMAIPFFRNSLLGDLWFTTTFFYAYEFLSQNIFSFSLKTKQVS